jgi:hypothetical protein
VLLVAMEVVEEEVAVKARAVAKATAEAVASGSS